MLAGLVPEVMMELAGTKMRVCSVWLLQSLPRLTTEFLREKASEFNKGGHTGLDLQCALFCFHSSLPVVFWRLSSLLHE